MKSISGAFLIACCSMLWATDALFRMPLVKSVDSMTIVLLEHVLCVIATFPLFLPRRKETRSLNVAGWGSLAFVGVMGSAIATALFTASFRHINPSVAILLQKVQPIFAVIGARVVLREKPGRQFYRWAVVAVIASTMVSLPDLWAPREILSGFPSLGSATAGRNLGISLAAGAAFLWGMCTVFGKWITNHVSFPVTSFLRFFWGLIGILVIVLARAGDSVVSVRSQVAYVFHAPAAIRAIFYIGLIPGVLAMNLYYAGLRNTKASSATFAEMFFPIAAVVINWIWLGQPLNTTQIVGAAILLCAVYFINRKPRPVAVATAT